MDDALFGRFVISGSDIFESASNAIFIAFTHQVVELSFQGAYARFNGTIHLLFVFRATSSFDCGFCIWHILILIKTYASIELGNVGNLQGLSMVVLEKRCLFKIWLF